MQATGIGSPSSTYIPAEAKILDKSMVLDVQTLLASRCPILRSPATSEGKSNNVVAVIGDGAMSAGMWARR